MSSSCEEPSDPSEEPGAYVFELACGQCSTCLIVYSAEHDRPFVECPSCGAFVGGELPPGVMLDLAEGYEEDGPPLQVHVAYAFVSNR